MSYPPPYAPPPPPPRRRSRRTLVIVLVSVALLCCGGLGAGGFFAVRTFLDATAPAREATRDFVSELERGDNAAAYHQLCDRAKQRHSLQDFDQRVQQLGRVVDHSVTGVSMHRTIGATTGTVTVRLTLADGGSTSYTFPLVRDGEQWQVCGDPF